MSVAEGSDDLALAVVGVVVVVADSVPEDGGGAADEGGREVEHMEAVAAPQMVVVDIAKGLVVVFWMVKG